MITFDNTTVKCLQETNFRSKVIKFVLRVIPIFDSIIYETNKTKKFIPSVEKWKFTTCVPLRKMLTESQDHLPLRHMDKKCYFTHF